MVPEGWIRWAMGLKMVVASVVVVDHWTCPRQSITAPEEIKTCFLIFVRLKRSKFTRAPPPTKKIRRVIESSLLLVVVTCFSFFPKCAWLCSTSDNRKVCWQYTHKHSHKKSGAPKQPFHMTKKKWNSCGGPSIQLDVHPEAPRTGHCR